MRHQAVAVDDVCVSSEGIESMMAASHGLRGVEVALECARIQLGLDALADVSPLVRPHIVIRLLYNWPLPWLGELKGQIPEEVPIGIKGTDAGCVRD